VAACLLVLSVNHASHLIMYNSLLWIPKLSRKWGMYTVLLVSVVVL